MTPTYIPEDRHFRYYVFTHINSEHNKFLTEGGTWADDFPSAMLWGREDVAEERAKLMKNCFDHDPNVRFVVGRVKVESDGFYAMKVV